MNGLYLVNGKQHIDNHTAIDHAQPHASSHELYKGILDGQGSAVFNGKIFVRKDAQKTDAKQTNKNLILSEEAVINTKPELQIFADDVRCTHGATIGQLDADSIFYLRSRGIPEKEARQVLTQAFARDVIDRVKVASVRESLERILFEKLNEQRH
jgi:Fe-S cluster assembly protein SufD